jgi:exopolysaccharide production protein ExoQ
MSISMLQDQNGTYATVDATTRKYGRAISQFAISYVLLVPLIFLASGGALSFEHGTRNTALGHRLGSLVDNGDSQSRNIELAFVYGTILFVVVPRSRAVLTVARSYPIITSLAILLPLSALWSQEPMQTLRTGFYSFVDVAFAFYLVRRFSPHSLMRLMIMLAAAVLLVSLGLVLLSPTVGLDQMEGKAAWQGLFVGKNNCAMAFNFLLIPLLYARLSNGWKRLARAVLILGIIGFVLLSQSRTGWLICAVNLVLWSGFRVLAKMRKLDAVFIVCLGSLLAISGVIVIAGHLSDFTSLIGKDATLTGRTEIWASLLLSIHKRPLLGYGYSAFWTGISGESGLIALAIGWVAGYAHNGYLEIALQLGLIGLGLTVLTLFFGIRDLMRSFQPNCPEQIGWYASTLVLTILYNFDESTFIGCHQLIWILYLIAILGLSQSGRNVRGQTTTRSDVVAKSVTEA